jgi:hypothetical protein
MSRWSGVLVAGGFTALAVAYTWPLALHFSTRTIGFQADASMWLWNLWHFRYAISDLHINPLWTELQYWPYGANLILHHYGLLYNAIGYFLQPAVGLVATYNLFIVGNLSVAGILVYVIARRAGAGLGAAFIGGVAYAFSSYSSVTLRTGVGLEYMSLSLPPLFVWACSAALQNPSLKYYAGAALALTAAWACNYYYFCFCLLLLVVFCLAQDPPLNIRFEKRNHDFLKIVAGTLLAFAAVWLIFSLSAGQIQFHGRGDAKALMLYVAPYLTFWTAAAIFLGASYRARVSLGRTEKITVAIFGAVVIVFLWVLMNLPMIWAVLHWLRAGESASPPNSWRGGGNPTDLMALLTPGYYQPLWGKWTSRVPGAIGAEHSFMSLTALAGTLWLWKFRGEDKNLRLWYAGLVFSFLFCLGPWLKIFGVHLYLPLPFYFTHLLPIYNNIQVGFRFTIFAHLFFALIFSVALTRWSHTKKSRWVIPVAFVIVALEFFPAPWPLYDARIPALFYRLGDRPDGAMLHVPFGALRP